jgi:hypothetical protein
MLRALRVPARPSRPKVISMPNGASTLAPKRVILTATLVRESVTQVRSLDFNDQTIALGEFPAEQGNFSKVGRAV